jgi:hypothetical protein
MPLTFNCACGKTLRVPDQHAGKRVKCPACNAVATAPSPEPMFEVVEDPVEPLAPVAPVKAKPTAKPAVADDDEDDGRRGYGVARPSRDDDEDEPRAKKKPNFRKGSRRRDDDEDDDDDRPRRKKRRPRSHREAGAMAGADAGKRILYMVGGGILVLIGIALAVAGWNMEGRGSVRLLIFGVILAICGLGTTVRGITGNFDDE